MRGGAKVCFRKFVASLPSVRIDFTSIDVVNYENIHLYRIINNLTKEVDFRALMAAFLMQISGGNP